MARDRAPTKAERERGERFRSIGCIACYIDGWPGRYYEWHHLVEGYRLGHRFVIPLCTWHHRGECGAGMTTRTMRTIYGPSLALEKNAFTNRYGTERELCERVDELIDWPAPEWPVSKVVPR